MNEDLKDKIAQLLTGGVHYYELNDPMLQDGQMHPEFAARWSSDVVKEVDDLAELFDQELGRRVEEARISELYGIYVIDGEAYSDIGGSGRNKVVDRIATPNTQTSEALEPKGRKEEK